MANQRGTRMLWPIVLVVSGLALILGAIVFILLSQFSDKPVTSGASAPVATSAERIPFPEVSRISVADAKAAYEGKMAIFVDVRDEQSYAQSHIPGALNIPVDTIQAQPNQAALDKNAWIITYCT